MSNSEFTSMQRDEIAGRIRELMTDQRIRPVDVVKACGVSSGTASNWQTGASVPRNQNLHSLADLLGVSWRYILFGEQDNTGSSANAINDKSPVESSGEYIGGVQEWDNDTEFDGDTVSVPIYTEIRLSAGPGSLENIQRNGPKLQMSRSTLRGRGVAPENVVCVKVSGNSMEPVFLDSGTVGVDMGRKDVVSGDIYAFEQESLLRVKILYLEPHGYRLRSYNAVEYPEESAKLEEINVIGRVFWYSVLF